MPRKSEPSFSLKQIIWDIAGTVGTDNWSALYREVNHKLEELHYKGELLEDIPEERKVRDLIELDIQRLRPEVVVTKLPRHVWHLRNDYEAIEQLAESVKAQQEAPKEAVQSFEQEEQIPSVAETTGHEQQLRAMISHLIKSLPDLSSPSMPCAPEPFVLPYEGQRAVAGTPIENDPAFQSLWEHLKDTEIPKLWNDLKTAKLEYFIAAAPHYSIESPDPEYVRREQEKREALRSRRDEVWQRYYESTLSLWQKLKELLLLDRLPSKCCLCRQPQGETQ